MVFRVVAAVALCPVTSWAAGFSGSLSMWADTKDTIVGYQSDGGACKYADKAMGGLTSPTAQTPYIQSRHYCAVNEEMYRAGATCGACYRIEYHGDQQQGLGHAGAATVQVVDSGAWATFDCHMSAFKKITSYDTSIFPISYEKVPCETSAQGAVAAVLTYDFYWTKFVFGNLPYPVQSAELHVGEQRFELQRVGGYWASWTGPLDGQVSFVLTEDQGSSTVLSSCFSGWKGRHSGASCTATQGSALIQVLGSSGEELPNATNVSFETFESVNLRGSRRPPNSDSNSDLNSTELYP